MKKIKYFLGANGNDLESQVNNWLANHQALTVITTEYFIDADFKHNYVIFYLEATPS